jgi:hypothetical protein
MRAWQSLPEAPSPVQPLIQESGASALRPEPADPTPPSEPGFTASYQLRSTPNESTNSFAKYLDFELPKPDPTYARSTSTSFLGRASHAASSVLLTHSASGRPRLNTAFCLGMLTLAAAHTAYRPYWERSSGAVFGDFGVTIGSNAGINVFHEFEPAIRDKARSMTPKFVYRLEERFTHDQPPRDSLSITGR